MDHMKKYGGFILAALMITGLLALPGCKTTEEKAKEAAGYAEEKAKEAAGYAGEKAQEAAEAVGKVTASWLGTTAANVGKNYNKSVVERLKYLEITVEGITHETKDGKKDYTIKLTLNNTAPDNEKIHIDNLLDDNYLIACDQNDYSYSLSPYGYDEDEDYDYEYEELVNPGKSHLTVYTELDEADEIAYLQFIDKKISLP
jgi:hypothetical protein